MIITQILQYPKDEATLRLKSVRVEGRVDQELIAEMTSLQWACFGLSAVQLGIPIRLVMVKHGTNFIFLSNPEIVKLSTKTWAYSEGCMSVGAGDSLRYFRRPKRVKVKYTDLDGNPRTIKAEGILARALQHEIDHLDGILIVDYKEVP